MYKLLDRYILKELFPPFFVSIIFFSFIFLLSKILEIADMIVNLNIPVLSIGKILVYSMPFFLQFTIPMSVMMSILITFLELSGSNEILALKAGGVSILRLLPPVIFFCLMGVVLTSAMTFYGLPWGKLSFKKEIYKIASNNISISFKEKTFIDSYDGLAIYADRVDKETNKITNIFIEDRKNIDSPITITAPKGSLSLSSNSFSLELYNGNIIQIDKKSGYVHRTMFGSYLFKPKPAFNKNMNKKSGKDDEEMYFSELRDYIKNHEKKDSKYYSAIIKLHEKFSLPTASIFLGLIAFALGLKNKTKKKSSGIFYGIILFVLYYLLLAIGWSLGESQPDVYPPFVAMWAPNLIIFIVSLFLLNLCIKEKDLSLKFWT